LVYINCICHSKDILELKAYCGTTGLFVVVTEIVVDGDVETEVVDVVKLEEVVVVGSFESSF